MYGELVEAVINTTQSFVDDFIHANADFHSKSGLSPKIVRTSTGKCCEWCEKLAGTYSYNKEAAYLRDEVFRRHKYCRGLVTYDPGNGAKVQNVHSKQWKTAEEHAKIEARKK